jgi:hypothetical protein
MGDLRIVDKVKAFRPSGYSGGYFYQITCVRLDSVDAWVREARRASSADHFAMSSNVRLGHKADGNRVGREVLELAAPASHWDRIAELVHELDANARPVVSHAQWTVRTAPETFRKALRRRP